MLVLGDVEAFDVTVGGARGDHRDLALERNEGLEDRGFGAEFPPDTIRIVALADDRLPLAVIAEAAGLDHRGQADRAIAACSVAGRGHVGIIGGADAEPL